MNLNSNIKFVFLISAGLVAWSRRALHCARLPSASPVTRFAEGEEEEEARKSSAVIVPEHMDISWHINNIMVYARLWIWLHNMRKHCNSMYIHIAYILHTFLWFDLVYHHVWRWMYATMCHDALGSKDITDMFLQAFRGVWCVTTYEMWFGSMRDSVIL